VSVNSTSYSLLASMSSIQFPNVNPAYPEAFYVPR